MFLFFTIAIVCLLLNFSKDIVKLLHISKLLTVLLNSVTTPAVSKLEHELDQARADLDHVQAVPAASGEYAQFVKTMRAEQRIKDLEERLRGERNLGRLKGVSLDLIASWSVKALLSMVLFFISVRHRYTPVMIFTNRFNFQPLEGLLSFPTGVPNAISVPVWVLSCNVTFRLVSSLIKRKK